MEVIENQADQEEKPPTTGDFGHEGSNPAAPKTANYCSANMVSVVIILELNGRDPG